MKKKIVLIISFMCMANVFSQEIERLFESKEAVFKSDGPYEAYRGIYVDEISNILEILKGRGIGGAKFFLDDNSYGGMVETVAVMSGMYYFKTGNIIFSASDSGVAMQKEKKVIASNYKNIKNGISFILKKGNGYIVYYVNDKGIPGAVDTEGLIYDNTEAIEYLKEYDEQKYEQSGQRATELGLSDRFRNNEVLVWGRTYYSTVDILEAYWGKSPYIISGQIQYDVQGYGYQCDFYGKKYKSYLCIVSPEGERINITGLTNFSNILSTYEDGCRFSTSMYVGFGGNIYYYIAGEEYTEVFRIRRTWGEPDLYAMAINGYTADSYGKYVEETLAKLSKEELRLLRNTVFALYGYTFKSEDLKNHFDKQVWYTDEGKTASDMTLPGHRQKLLELVQAEEAKR